MWLFIGNKKEFEKLNQITEDNKKQLQDISNAMAAIHEEQKRIQEEWKVVKAEHDAVKTEKDFLSVLETGFKTAGIMVEELKGRQKELSGIRINSEHALAVAKQCLAESEENKKKTELMLQEEANRRNEILLLSNEQKKKAAMALNLCTTSISNIISCGNVEAMEMEYNTILNNINLQAIVKDEALLNTMRTILDTINFFRLQEGDRKRLEERHHQRMNNLLWDSLSSAGGLFVVGGNPWTIGAAAAIQAGSMFVGYNRRKKDEQMKFDDDLWKLERSAIEQLHALRTSLFETAWRLSDNYNFKDEWRLTIPQIEWFNEIRTELDDMIRYKKLNQYQDDFEAYPYYWYELGVAAHNVYENRRKTKDEKHPDDEMEENWKENALKCFDQFLKLDEPLGLLRQNVIGADARLRHVELLAKDKGWASAVKTDADSMDKIKRLAVDDPELLLKAALIYSSAYQELKGKEEKSLSEEEKEEKKEWVKRAIDYFDMLVMRGNNLPMSSIYLSYLYLETGRKNDYEELKALAKQQDAIKLVPKDGTPEKRTSELKEIMDSWRESRCKPLVALFEKYFDIILRLAHRDVFNFDPAQQRENIYNWIKENEKNIQDNLNVFLEPVKREINASFSYAEKTLGFEPQKLYGVARDINIAIKVFVMLFQSKKISELGNKEIDYHTDIYMKIVSMFDSLKRVYSRNLSEIIESQNKDAQNISNRLNPDDINALLDFHLEAMNSRYSLIGLNGTKSAESEQENYFSFRRDTSLDEKFKDGGSFSWTIILNDPAVIDYLIQNKWSYTIQCENCDDYNRDFLIKLIISIYPKDTTSLRYSDTKNKTYCEKITDWFARMGKNIKDTVNGSEDYVISISDNIIDVNYTRVKEDECFKTIECLGQDELERQIKMLGLTYGLSKNEEKDQRLIECFKKWIAPKLKQIDEENNPKRRNDLIEKLKKDLKKFCLSPAFLNHKEIKAKLSSSPAGPILLE